MAATAADRVLVVTTLDKTSLRDSALAAERAASLGASKVELVVNRVRPRITAKASSPNVDDAIDIVRAQLIGVIPEDDRVIISANREIPLITQTSNGAALAYYNIARRITNQQVPLMKIK